MVPAGTTVLVKSLLAYSYAATPAVVSLRVIAANGSSNLLGSILQVPAAAARNQDLWIALEPGDRLRVESDTASINFWVSGSLLNGVSGWVIPLSGPTVPE